MTGKGAGVAFEVLSGLGAVPAHLRGAVVAIGNFDGCHRGHQRVFAAAAEMAAATAAPLVMLTFEPHPRDVFAPAPFMFRLTGPEAKARLAEALGFDAIAVMTFDRVLAAVEAEDFVAGHLVGALGVRGAVVGADFHFGRARRGTPAFLQEQGRAHGFPVKVLDMLEAGDGPVSSSRVREALGAGEVAEANRLLGYHMLLGGEVATGDRRGRALGFPTANFALPPHSGFAQGVYAVRARLGDRRLDGVASHGKPMFENASPPFEVHLFDFDEDIYGRRLDVALIAFLRGQEVFSGLDELAAAMHRDAAAARTAIAAARPLSELDRRLGFVG